jgi:hypothetical protein
LLGHVGNKEGLLMEPQKIASILKVATLKNTKELVSFLGLCNFYWHYIKGFVAKIKWLRHMLKKASIKHEWPRNVRKPSIPSKHPSFKDLFLITHDWTHLFYVHVDASNVAIGVVFTQNQDGKLIDPSIIQVNCWTWQKRTILPHNRRP